MTTVVYPASSSALLGNSRAELNATAFGVNRSKCRPRIESAAVSTSLRTATGMTSGWETVSESSVLPPISASITLKKSGASTATVREVRLGTVRWIWYADCPADAGAPGSCGLRAIVASEGPLAAASASWSRSISSASPANVPSARFLTVTR